VRFGGSGTRVASPSPWLSGSHLPYLARLETSEGALDRRSFVLTLANALEVTPSELVDDRALTGSGWLCAVSMGEPG
jgi:hypothetical protein